MVDPTDLFTGGAAWVACVALGLRANLLKPQLATGVTAPTLVWVSLWILSATCGMAGLGLWFSPEMKPVAREMVVYTALAASSVVMLVNLIRQRPKCAPSSLGETTNVVQARWSNEVMNK